MKLITLGEAERDFAESVAYYEPKEPGLGRRFRDEVVAAVDRIRRNPELPRLRHSLRRGRGNEITPSRRARRLARILSSLESPVSFSHFVTA
jgi:plasmid stabilization system protein ParE